jgi:hypothetical protein
MLPSPFAEELWYWVHSRTLIDMHVSIYTHNGFTHMFLIISHLATIEWFREGEDRCGFHI